MLVIKMRENLNMQLPEITLATETLSEVPDKLVCHLFDNLAGNNQSLVNLAGHQSFTDKEKEFVFKNADFFITCMTVGITIVTHQFVFPVVVLMACYVHHNLCKIIHS